MSTMYTIVEVMQGKATVPVTESDGKPIIFTNGKEAAYMATVYTANYEKLYQPRPFKMDVNWREREENRFADGSYTHLPWVEENWWQRVIKKGTVNDHYAHVSRSTIGSIAFTENEMRGIADRHTRMRPGRYLERYASDFLSGAQIRQWAMKFAILHEPVELKWAKTPDEIENVYINGPNSCMSKRGGDYSSDQHPTRAYGAGDLQIAYLERDKSVSARVVCWPEKKVFSRIYGDHERLQFVLKDEMGFMPDDGSGFNGAKLLRLRQKANNFAVPYVDNYRVARDDGDFLIIGGGNSKSKSKMTIELQRTDGLSGDGAISCDRCGDIYHRDDVSHVFHTRYDHHVWCSDCTSQHAFFCSGTERNWENPNRVTLHDGTVWSAFHFSQHGGVCDYTGDNFNQRDLVTLADGRHWNRWTYRTNGFRCQDCQQHHPNANGQEVNSVFVPRCDSCEMNDRERQGQGSFASIRAR